VTKRPGCAGPRDQTWASCKCLHELGLKGGQTFLRRGMVEGRTVPGLRDDREEARRPYRADLLVSIFSITSCLFGGLSRHERGTNPAERPDAEEPPAARGAAVRGKSKQAFESDQSPLFDALTRERLEIEISASRAVGVGRKRDRHASSIKPAVAGVAPPGPQPGQCSEEIHYARAT
jgi:hypothetical protein